MGESGGAFSFIIKSIVLTVAVVFLLQLKVGRQTIEHRSLAWMQESVAVDALRSVAAGAVYVGEKAFDYISSLINDGKSSSRNGKERSVWERAIGASDSSHEE